MSEIQFEWDENKNISNNKKHGIAFESALKIFSEKVLFAQSNRKSEERHLAIGKSEGSIITVVFTKRPHAIRIISARKARKKEKAAYSALYGG